MANKYMKMFNILNHQGNANQNYPSQKHMLVAWG
jgi:hypothetical protein